MAKKNNNPAKGPASSSKPENTELPAAKQPPMRETAAKTASPQGNDSFGKKLKGKEKLILLGAIVLGCIIIFRDFITLDKVYLFKDIGSDSLNIYYPWLTHISDYIKTQGIPSWTFSQGLGQNMFPFWLGDFFSDVLVLFSKEKIPYMLAYVEIIKIILCGFVFYKYLLQIKISEFVAAISSFLFAFCGYIVLGGGWTVFSNEALYFVIILYGFERWLNNGKFLWFVIGLTCMALIQPFYLFMDTIFLAVYIPVRYNDLNKGDWKKFPGFVLKTVGLSTLAVAISAYQLFPDMLQYIESPRVGGEAQLSTRLKAQPMFALADDVLRFTTTFRAFGSDMLGTGSGFQGWQNYLEAPLFYCGICCLVTFPQAFVGFTKGQKIAYGILAGVFVLPIFFPFFRYAFWAFTVDYFRTFSLVITLLLLLFTAKGLNHILQTGRVNLIVLGVTVVVLLALLYTPNEQFAPAINSGLRSFATLLILVYAGLLVGLSLKENLRNSSMLILVITVFVEMIYFSSTTVNDRDVMTGNDLKEKIGYNDYTVDALNLIKSKDNTFYRVNKDFGSGLAIHRSINDAKVQGYFGTPSYFSFNQKNYIKFLGEVNALDAKDENSTRWAMGLTTRPLLFTLAAGKYWITKNPGNQIQNFGYDEIGKFGDVRVLQNRFFLPLGFAYDTVLDDASFKRLSPFQKDLYLLRGCVIDSVDNDLLAYGKKFNIADTAAVAFSFDAYNQFVSALRKDSFSVTRFKESDIKGVINLAAPKILFFSIPYDEGWTAKVNGANAKLYRINVGFLGLKLPAGKQEVELKFEPRYMVKGGLVSLLAIAVFVGLLVISKKKKPQVS